MPAIVLSASAIVCADASAGNNDVFGQFTRHIQEQIAQDKLAFLQASGCTKWFYKKGKQPAPASPVDRISWNTAVSPPSEADCHRRYPGGLNEVRDDFAKTQTFFSLSLTFYEFALVADRDDDSHYNPNELRDLFQALTLSYDEAHAPAQQGDALTGRFDTWYKGRDLDRVMEGMSSLYERGYRVTSSDRAELDRVMQ